MAMIEGALLAVSPFSAMVYTQMTEIADQKIRHEINALYRQNIGDLKNKACTKMIRDAKKKLGKKEKKQLSREISQKQYDLSKEYIKKAQEICTDIENQLKASKGWKNRDNVIVVKTYDEKGNPETKNCSIKEAKKILKDMQKEMRYESVQQDYLKINLMPRGPKRFFATLGKAMASFFSDYTNTAPMVGQIKHNRQSPLYTNLVLDMGNAKVEAYAKAAGLPNPLAPKREESARQKQEKQKERQKESTRERENERAHERPERNRPQQSRTEEERPQAEEHKVKQVVPEWRKDPILAKRAERIEIKEATMLNACPPDRRDTMLLEQMMEYFPDSILKIPPRAQNLKLAAIAVANDPMLAPKVEKSIKENEKFGENYNIEDIANLVPQVTQGWSIEELENVKNKALSESNICSDAPSAEDYIIEAVVKEIHNTMNEMKIAMKIQKARDMSTH